MPTLTSTQAEALTWLEASHAASPDWDAGFNPESKAHARACRHTLEPMGLVRINKISAQHFRYALTESGRTALDAYRKLRDGREQPPGGPSGSEGFDTVTARPNHGFITSQG